MSVLRMAPVAAVLVLVALVVSVPGVASEKNLLYVQSAVNGLEVIKVYDVNDPGQQPVQTLEGITSWSSGMIADKAGNLYVSQGNISEPVVIFKAGRHLPSTVLSNPGWTQSADNPSQPIDVAVGKDGSVYVAVAGGHRSGILVYSPGSKTPKTILQYNSPAGTPFCIPTGVTVDVKSNVYMGCGGYTVPNTFGSSQTGHVIEFPAGSASGVDTGITVAAEVPRERSSALGFEGYTNDVQIDSKGNILVLFGGAAQASAVFVYPPGGSRRPSRIISLGSQNASASGGYSFTFRLDATDTHFFVGRAYEQASQGGEVEEYTYPGGQIVGTFKVATSPLGIAVGPASIGL
jgi:hypothetical protein